MKRDLAYVEDFARKAHEGQTRKYTNTPYILHPLNVVDILEQFYYYCSQEMLAAAILHDVVEDTTVTLSDIEREFGQEVGTLVFWLTNKSTPEDGNRKLRKAIDRAHLREAPFTAQIIKLADILDNCRDIVEHDRKFAEVYLKEVLLLLEIMSEDVKRTGIYKEAEQSIDSNLIKIKECSK